MIGLLLILFFKLILTGLRSFSVKNIYQNKFSMTTHCTPSLHTYYIGLHAVFFKPVLQAPLLCTFCMSPLSDTPDSTHQLFSRACKTWIGCVWQGRHTKCAEQGCLQDRIEKHSPTGCSGPLDPGLKEWKCLVLWTFTLSSYCLGLLLVCLCVCMCVWERESLWECEFCVSAPAIQGCSTLIHKCDLTKVKGKFWPYILFWL